MNKTRPASLCVAVLLVAVACGGGDTGSAPSDKARHSDWGSGITYDDCTEQGLTDYGIRTGQKWIGDFYADLYPCKAPTNISAESADQPTTGSTSPPGTEPEATSTQPPEASTTLPPLRGLRYELVFAGVRQTLDDEYAMPLQIVGRPGGRFNYMITREGRVWIVEEGTFSNPPVLDLRESVGIGSETGLLGVALHPTDPQRMFLYYTDLEFDIILAEYQLDDELRRAIPSSARTLMNIPTRSDFHKGGMISFGPDGYLYLGVGDDGYSFNGQDPTTLLGAILRINVDGGEPYGIPDDQPPLSPEAPEVYLYGIRNPWRFWIDPVTNIIYIGDVGADAYEEIDITSLDAPGTNFGWSWLEGPQWGPFNEGVHCRENPETCDTSGFTAAALALPHSPEVCAVIGGVVYRGTAIPELTGTYFYSDACGGFLRSFSWNGELAVDLRDWTEQVEAQTRVLSFGVDTRGEMYVMTADDVFRVEPVR
ncbi:MAG: PQQ-dependent sugar dehydrogenase [bacterium]|nr:PQQ-dependent sugar dehydrogenase [Acidimicrobiia bacterium]MCY4651256.1 PQQ-dependent sugar dehydrogenase [bacterium]